MSAKCSCCVTVRPMMGCLAIYQKRHFMWFVLLLTTYKRNSTSLFVTKVAKCLYFCSHFSKLNFWESGPCLGPVHPSVHHTPLAVRSWLVLSQTFSIFYVLYLPSDAFWSMKPAKPTPVAIHVLKGLYTGSVNILARRWWNALTKMEGSTIWDPRHMPCKNITH